MIGGLRAWLVPLLATWLVVSGPVTAVSAAEAAEAEEGPATIVETAERGPVIVRIEISPAAPVIGDVIELALTVTSEPDVEVLMPEFGEALGRFEIVDFAPSERLDDLGRVVSRQVYRLQPGRSGSLAVPPLRVEFVDRREGYAPAPEGEDAYEVLTERIPLEVAPVLAADAPLELEPPHPDLGPRRGPGLPVWLWTLLAVAVLAGAAPFVARGVAAARARQRQRSAYEIARSAFDELIASGRPDAEGVDAFYVSLSLIVRRYLEDRFGLRSPELTTQEFLTEMGRSPDLDRAHQRLLREFLETADLVKFAGLRPGEEVVSESIEKAERFLEETRHPLFVGDTGGAPAEAHRA